MGKTSSVFRLLFGFHVPVSRRQYLIVGVTLMTLKYLLEALLIWRVTGIVVAPWFWLLPSVARWQFVPQSLAWVLVFWTLPFLWIGLSMSVRRALDANISPLLAGLFLVPIVNYQCMIVLACVPSRLAAPFSDRIQPPRTSSALWRAIATQMVINLAGGFTAVVIGAAQSERIGLNYGLTLFCLTPFLSGLVAGITSDRPWTVASLGLLTAALALLLFAMEGVICILMALPLAEVAMCIGVLCGKIMRRVPRTPWGNTLPMVLILIPLTAFAESYFRTLPLTEVRTAVDINAAPDIVWRHVVSFSEIPAPREWYFRTGIAYPVRARLEGTGIGAIRYCEFSTGPFVEPITAWEAPQRLSFDVTEEPAPMVELSPYHIHPPHLDHYFSSKRGEFRLIPLPDGRTRLEGSTWYTLNIHPAPYWRPWAEWIVHAIHTRVLTHIQREAEAAAPALAARTD